VTLAFNSHKRKQLKLLEINYTNKKRDKQTMKQTNLEQTKTQRQTNRKPCIGDDLTIQGAIVPIFSALYEYGEIESLLFLLKSNSNQCFGRIVYFSIYQSILLI
jgi:hypothetical protein